MRKAAPFLMVAPPALSAASRVGSTVDDAPTDSLPDMVTRDENSPQPAAHSAMLCANIYIILSACIYAIHLHATQGSTAVRLWAGSAIAAAVIAIASAALAAARMGSDAARQREAAAAEKEEHAAHIRLHEYDLARKNADHAHELALLRDALVSAMHRETVLTKRLIDELARALDAATAKDATRSTTAPTGAAQQVDAQPPETHTLVAQTLDAQLLDTQQVDAQPSETHTLATQTLDAFQHDTQTLDANTLAAQTFGAQASSDRAISDSTSELRALMAGAYLPPGVLFEREPAPLRLAPPPSVNPDDAVRVFTERMAGHFAQVNGAARADSRTGVAAVLVATPAVPACERRRRRPRGRRGGRRAGRARTSCVTKLMASEGHDPLPGNDGPDERAAFLALIEKMGDSGVAAMHVGTWATSAGASATNDGSVAEIDDPEGADFLALFDADNGKCPGVPAVHAGTSAIAAGASATAVCEEEAATFLALIDSIGDARRGVAAMHAGVSTTSAGASTPATTAVADDATEAEDAAVLHYASELDEAGFPGLQLMVELKPDGVTASEFYHYFIDYIDTDDQQQIITGALPDGADVSTIDPELDWHDSLGAAVLLRLAPDNTYDVSEILLVTPHGANITDFARMFVNMPLDARQRLVEGDCYDDEA